MTHRMDYIINRAQALGEAHFETKVTGVAVAAIALYSRSTNALTQVRGRCVRLPIQPVR